jgi:tRNA 2-thiocytidine biosynthesis protein TtcA
MQRVAIKKMLADWERDFPGRTETIFSALRHVELDHLADTRRFDFVGLDARRVASATESQATSEPFDVELPRLPPGGFMSARDEAELDDRLDSLAVPA